MDSRDSESVGCSCKAGVECVCNQFCDWNPLKDDFGNTEFNKYLSGPGAALTGIPKKDQRKDDEERFDYPYLVFKDIPAHFNKATIRSLLKDIKIRHCYLNFRTGYYFVYLYTLSDVEDSYRKLEKISNDWTVEVGHMKRLNQYQEPHIDNVNENNNEVSADEPNTADNTIDINARDVKFQSAKLEHPKFKLKTLVEPSDYDANDSLLLRHDPKRHLLHVSYEHVLERCKDFHFDNLNIDNQCEYQYRSGATIKRFTKDFNKTLAKQKFVDPEEHNKLLEKFDLKQCICCNQFCVSRCAVCKTYFCSKLCQEKMHDKHTSFCNENEKITYIADTKSALPTDELIDHFNDDYMPKSNTLVYITAFVRSNLVYVRSSALENELIYFDTMEKVKIFSSTAQRLQKLPQCGELVILKLYDGEYTRAMILQVEDPSNIYLICIDYGNIDVQPLENLYAINEQLKRLPRFAVPVLLKNVPNFFMNEQYRKLLYAYQITHKLKIQYQSTDYDQELNMYNVDLFDQQMHLNLNKALRSMSTPIEPQSNDENFFESSLISARIPTGMKVQLVIMNNFFVKYGYISCTTPDYALEIEKFQQDLQSYGESLDCQPYAPLKNELCVAKYDVDGKWYRGRCVELVGDGFPTICFIDYGNIDYVSVNCIRRYPAVFTFPLLTIECEIYNDSKENYSDELILKLQKHLTIGNIIECDELIYNKKDQNYTIKMLSLFK